MIDFKKFKNIMMDAAAVIAFAVIASVYFYPAFQGKRLNAEDNAANDGLKVEINNYREQHNGETPRWINSIFSGMPTYQIAPSYDSAKPMGIVEKVYHLGLPDYVWYVFASMLGFYILMRAFDFRRWMAVLGAIVWAFSSYFFIIIAAGHLWKAITLAYIPPTIAGVVMCFKGKYLWGFVVTALFAALQIGGNHVQMTYYFLIPEILMFIAFVIKCIVKKEFAHMIKATAAIVVAALIAIGLNASNLYHTYKYSEDTMRGRSELVKEGKQDDQTKDGLERSYITQWSYGISETWSLLIPNIKGGSSSVPLSQSETAMKHADNQLSYSGIYNQLPQYFGEQPGTSGPVYVGALVCLLFILALFVIPNKSSWKWVLIVSTLLSILLAWGKNFMGFTDFFIDHIPMYSKFRTVSSILVVAEFTIPLLALMGLKRFVDGMKEPETRKKMFSALLYSTVITAGICLLFAVAPHIAGDCVSSMEHQSFSQMISQGQMDQVTAQALISSLSDMRGAMVSADAWRSLMIILLGAIILFLYYKTAVKNNGKISWATSAALGSLIVIVCLGDMWMINRRYMNNDMFHAPVAQVQPEKTPMDEYILNKSGEKRDYRVLNLTVSTFNDNTTSFFYNSIGGYHPAKLRRYQELIENCISQEIPKVMDMFTPERLDTAEMVRTNNLSFPIYDLSDIDADSICPVINMLNTRWFIYGNEKSKIPLENTTAYGNAWFVDSIKVVENANQELDFLKKLSPRHNAIVNKEFAGILGEKTAPADSADVIKLTDMSSMHVTYEAESKKGGVAVFSEIYDKGWEATIDGKPAEVARANYVLRAMKIPAGKHKIEMTFNARTVEKTETVAYISLSVLLLAIALAAFLTWRKCKKEEEEKPSSEDTLVSDTVKDKSAGNPRAKQKKV